MLRIVTRIEDSRSRGHLQLEQMSAEVMMPRIGSESQVETELGDITITLQSVLKETHRANSLKPIQLPNLAGVFPSSVSDVLPVVVDANTLRNDILHSCKRDGELTTLVNAANSGLLRLFCAEHIIEEVYEHSQEWAASGGVPEEVFRSCWGDTYLPQLRVVTHIPYELLSPEESRRMDELRLVDEDDVPSATLSLLLEAFYLTEDKAAAKAVYGDSRSSDNLHAWLEALRAGSDMGLLGSMLNAALLAGVLSGGALWGLARGLAKSVSLPVVVTAAAGAGYVAYKMAPESKRRAAGAIGNMLRIMTGIYAERERVAELFNPAAPVTPSWTELATLEDVDSLLVRACLHTLARSKRSDQSAAQLAGQLPALPVAQSEGKVRGVLRSQVCFAQVARGRWQVGEALVRATLDDVAL